MPFLTIRSLLLLKNGLPAGNLLKANGKDGVLLPRSYELVSASVKKSESIG